MDVVISFLENVNEVYPLPQHVRDAIDWLDDNRHPERKEGAA